MRQLTINNLQLTKTFSRLVIVSLLVIVLFSILYPVAADAQGRRIPGRNLPGGGLSVDPNCADVGGVPIPSAFCNDPGGTGVGGIACLFGFCLFGGPAGETTAIGVILNVINILLAVSAILAVLFVIISGIKYILAHGNTEAAEEAKKALGHAVLGLAIIVLSFVIIRVLSEALIFGNV